MLEQLTLGSAKGWNLSSRRSSRSVLLSVPRSFGIPHRVRPKGQTLLTQADLGNGASPTSAAAPAAKAKKPDVDHVKLVMEEIARGDKVIVCQTAPAVRVAIGEEFDLPPGTATTGKMVAALRKLGFHYVFDTLAGADLTIMEEGNELMERIYSNIHPSEHPAPLPMFTSCCPGWVELLEKTYPEMIPHVSSTKSPHMIVGSAIKNFFSKKIGRKPQDVICVSIMPCLKKQGEADRIMMQTAEGIREVDHVITTRELAALIKEQGWDYTSLPDEEYDEFLGIGSGAGAIFGTTGGVMEAALRTVYDLASGELLPRLQLSEVRGLEGIKEASVTIRANPEGPLKNTMPVEVRVAVANGLGNAKKLMKAVQEGTANYHFVEVMACPGGCIGGGGQPRSKDKEALLKRQQGLYGVDERKTLRRSYESPVVKAIYNDWLGKPGSHEAHAALHTFYEPNGAESFDITAPRPEPLEAPACNLPAAEEEVCVRFAAAGQPEAGAGQKPTAVAH